MSTPTVYVICDQNCKFEGMTKEQILTAIMQAVNEGTIGNIDAGFITTIKTINGTPLKFFVGEQAAYDALTDEEKTNLFAIITNDTSKAGIDEAIKSLQESIKGHGEQITELKKHKLEQLATVTITEGAGSVAGEVFEKLNNTFCALILDGPPNISGTLFVKNSELTAAAFGSGYIQFNTAAQFPAENISIRGSDGNNRTDISGLLTIYKIGTI